MTAFKLRSDLDSRATLRSALGMTVALAIALTFEFSVTANEKILTLALIAGILALVAVVANGYASSREYLFSSGFWLAVAIVFYIAIPATLMATADDVDGLNIVLTSVIAFLLGYIAVYFPVVRSLTRTRSMATVNGGPCAYYALGRRGLFLVLFLFAAFKIFGLLLFFRSGYDKTILEIVTETQNAGAAYLYRLIAIGNILYLFLLVEVYQSRKHIRIAILATLVVAVESVLTSNRYQLIVLVLWNLFLFHRKIRPIKIIKLVLLTPLLITIVAFFGYTRSIGVGSADVLVDAVVYFASNSEVILDLFVARLDMLPEMVAGFQLYDTGALPTLYGTSYLYAFLHAIPRTVWQEKPPLTAALLTAQTHPNAFAEGVLIYPSVIIEGFLNLNWMGVLLAGAGTGLLCVAYDRMLFSKSMTRNVWALTFFTFPIGLFVEGVHSNFFANLLYVSALYFLLVWTLRVTGGLRKQFLQMPCAT